MSLVEHMAGHVTVGVFTHDKLREVETLAHDLAMRSHRVSIQTAEQLRRRTGLRLGASLKGGMLLGATVVAGIGMTLAIVALVFGLVPRAFDTSLIAFLGALGVASAAGGLVGVLFRLRTPRTDFDAAMEALAKPGRFALVVETPAARRPFVGARLTRSGALVLGSN